MKNRPQFGPSRNDYIQIGSLPQRLYTNRFPLRNDYIQIGPSPQRLYTNYHLPATIIYKLATSLQHQPGESQLFEFGHH